MSFLKWLRSPKNDGEVLVWREDVTRAINDMPNDYYLDVAKGNITGTSVIHKFGEGNGIDTADGFVDLWDGTVADTEIKTYTFSATADIDRIVSTDAGDTQDIEIQGLDTNWDLTVQTVTLTGQTAVALTTPLIRVFRLKNNGSTNNAGDVYCYVNVATTGGIPDTIANTRAMIQAGNNQTLMSIFAIPSGYTGYMMGFYAATSHKLAAYCDFHMHMRQFGGVFQLKHSSTLATTGTSSFSRQPKVPIKISAKTDIKHSADSSVNAMGVSSGFEIHLVKD